MPWIFWSQHGNISDRNIPRENWYCIKLKEVCFQFNFNHNPAPPLLFANLTFIETWISTRFSQNNCRFYPRPDQRFLSLTNPLGNFQWYLDFDTHSSHKEEMTLKPVYTVVKTQNQYPDFVGINIHGKQTCESWAESAIDYLCFSNNELWGLSLDQNLLFRSFLRNDRISGTNVSRKHFYLLPTLNNASFV